MNIEQLHQLFEDFPNENEFVFDGECMHCQKQVTITIGLCEKGFEIKGQGAMFQRPKTRLMDVENEVIPEGKLEPLTLDRVLFFKCENCYEAYPTFSHWQECEVFSRVVGYYRPVAQYNKGKKAEYDKRTNFQIRSG